MTPAGRPALERHLGHLLRRRLGINILRPEALSLNRNFIGNMLLISNISRLDLIILFNRAPRVDSRIGKAVNVTEPPRVMFAVRGNSGINTSALTIMATGVDLDLHNGTRIERELLRGFDVNRFNTGNTRIEREVSSYERGRESGRILEIGQRRLARNCLSPSY